MGPGTSGSKRGCDGSLSDRIRDGDELTSDEFNISLRRTAVERGEGEGGEDASERGSGESGRVRVRGSGLI